MNTKIYERIVLFVFLAFLFGFLLMALIIPDVSFSQRENRYLQTLPEFTAEALFSGEFMSEFEEYCSDQFPSGMIGLR